MNIMMPFWRGLFGYIWGAAVVGTITIVRYTYNIIQVQYLVWDTSGLEGGGSPFCLLQSRIESMLSSGLMKWYCLQVSDELSSPFALSFLYS